jgi:hypothetical protein
MSPVPTRLGVRSVVGWPRELLLVAAVIFCGGCSITRTILLADTGAAGPPLVIEFETGIFSTGGDVVATLPTGETLRGRWTEIDSGTDLGFFQVATPSGPITAYALAENRTPNGVATLFGDDVNAICIYEGTASRGVAVCADTNGRQYVGNW